jgi:imidazolonepropionase
MQADRIFVNARLATMAPRLPGLGVIEPGMVAEAAGRIIYAGPMQKIDAPEIVDCAGRWITPGLIDCHTHAVYSGDRAAEFELRLQGASYTEIAAAGGGIASTVKATRAARDPALAAQALRHP